MLEVTWSFPCFSSLSVFLTLTANPKYWQRWIFRVVDKAELHYSCLTPHLASQRLSLLISVSYTPVHVCPPVSRVLFCCPTSASMMPLFLSFNPTSWILPILPFSLIHSVHLPILSFCHCTPCWLYRWAVRHIVHANSVLPFKNYVYSNRSINWQVTEMMSAFLKFWKCIRHLTKFSWCVCVYVCVNEGWEPKVTPMKNVCDH